MLQVFQSTLHCHLDGDDDGAIDILNRRYTIIGFTTMIIPLEYCYAFMILCRIIHYVAINS
jgi:hypothetical protein